MQTLPGPLCSRRHFGFLLLQGLCGGQISWRWPQGMGIVGSFD